MRRFLGGRQPLCGIGVISRIRVICRPASNKPRNAASRPAPAPFTWTAISFIP